MNTKKPTQAELYIRNRAAGLWHAPPKPLRDNYIGREIFSDGSWIIKRLSGEISHGAYEPEEWIMLEMEAFGLGRKHRRSRMRMCPDYLSGGKIHPDRVCRQYCAGFYSIPDWPKREPSAFYRA